MTKSAIRYLLITFLITYLCWGILAIFGNARMLKFGQVLFWILYILGGISPFISAFFAYKFNKDKKAYTEFKSGLLKLRVNVGWYIFIAIVPLCFDLFLWTVLRIKGSIANPLNKIPIISLLLLFPQMIIGGGLEEVGWRGLLLPEFLKRLSAWKATLVVGIIWTLWHIPLWFINGLPQQSFNFFYFAISVISMSFIFTTLYLGTRSILLCIFLHSIFNTYGQGINSPNISEPIKAVVELLIFFSIFLIYTKLIKRREEGTLLQGRL